MAELKLPNIAALETLDAQHWMTDEGIDLVTKTYHDAWVADLTALFQSDMDWARRVCAARGIDLDDLADRDPTYRSEFRI
jgi:hypothetical protein